MHPVHLRREIILRVQQPVDGWTHSLYCFFWPLIIPLWTHYFNFHLDRVAVAL